MPTPLKYTTDFRTAVYSKSMPSLILGRVQTVLRDLADMSEERSNAFPLTLGDNETLFDG